MKCNLSYLVLFTVIASSGINLVFQEKADAWLNICNKGSTRIESLAVGYHENGDWKSDGWWSLSPGECGRVYEHDLKNSGKLFYYYVEGKGWSNQSDAGFCIATNKRFTFYERDIMSRCGQTITKDKCIFNSGGFGCSNTTDTFFTKFVNFAKFRSGGRNYILDLRN
jgi:uncharacterized membrane protein